MNKTLQKIDGRYLKYMREKQGLSLRALAEKIYVSKSSVQRWESSYIPENPDVLEKISQVFGVSVDDMRRQSAEMFAEDRLTPDERAELKFGILGIKGVGKIIGVAAIIVIIVLIILLLFILF